MSVYNYAEHPELYKHFAKSDEPYQTSELQEKTTKFDYETGINSRLAKHTEAKYSVEFDYNTGNFQYPSHPQF